MMHACPMCGGSIDYVDAIIEGYEEVIDVERDDDTKRHVCPGTDPKIAEKIRSAPFILVLS